ncbi:hypothetical protein EDB92DRAFT_1899290 [Lactarius akahatsu]|uniref:Ankyrin repeat protein n=1 Tax=Lactarius akahatsu TaxID=416441 RepID=A0AAD4L827_9AGAM|nr:hypothetical protein EDB92DRAFT_1899290 [Lactarius akahatsu]
MREEVSDLLSSLPVELLYEIQFYAVSDSLPIVGRRLHHIFMSAPAIIKADYVMGRRLAHPSKSCLLGALLKRPAARPPEVTFVRLPRWLFLRLGPSGEEALPLLRYLFGRRDLSIRPIPDSHHGFPLASAVKAGAIPLVRFLLEQGASPYSKDALAVRLAVKRHDLDLVRLLIDTSKRSLEETGVGSDILKFAVKLGAGDIAKYLMNEKGCVPDLETISLLRE